MLKYVNAAKFLILILFSNLVISAGLSTKSSLSKSLNSSGGTFNSNSSINSTPTVDRYAALKDLDERLREAKIPDVAVTIESAGTFEKAKL